MDVRHACHNAGLEVVATMCDMGSNIVKDWKHLGVSEMIPFFRFQRQEVAAVCDLPHVLKYTHNLVLKHDVSNVECEITVNGKQLTGTTNWEDILKVYEVDFGPMKEIMQILHCHKKGPHLNTIERFHIHTEAIANNQINDDHTIFPNAIFDVLTKTNRP